VCSNKATIIGTGIEINGWQPTAGVMLHISIHICVLIIRGHQMMTGYLLNYSSEAV